MDNFEFLSSTRIIFGKGTESGTGAEIRKYGSRVLLHYGGGSIKKTGLYDKIVKSLKEAQIEFIELGGAQPNPRLGLVKEGIALCRSNNIDFILAVGGGSVIDSAKAIALGVPFQGDVWDMFLGKVIPTHALPTGAVLTFPASGSEASKSCVITSEDGWYKRSVNENINRPVFAIMNPELSYTLPPYQTACGIADIMAHVIERYFSPTTNVELTDRLCEAVLKTLINNAPVVMKEPENYNARAEIMRSGTIAHDDLLSTGRTGDFASHWIEHELSGLYDVAHGAGLSVILPAWMRYIYKKHVQRFLQFAVRVWNVEQNYSCPEITALEGIEKMTAFFRSLGLPVSLGELEVNGKKVEISPGELNEIVKRCKTAPDGTAGNLEKLKKDDIMNILKLAL